LAQADLALRFNLEELFWHRPELFSMQLVILD